MRLSRSTTQWHSLSWSQQQQKRLLDLRSPRISTWPLHLHGIAHTHRVKLSFPFSLRLHIAPLLSSETSSLSGIPLNNHLTHTASLSPSPSTIKYQSSSSICPAELELTQPQGNFYIVVFARIQEERGYPSPIDCLPVVQLCWWSDILLILLRMKKRKMQSRPFGHANVSTCQLPEASPLKPEVQKRFRV